MTHRSLPIGVFDSGIGGLSVLRHLQRELPHERFFYAADQAHVPYGSRSLTEIRELSEAMVRFLLSENAKLIVVACNTASGAALNYLRERFADTPFVGMEPAVKPAAKQTKSGKVGVLATAGTFESQRYLSLMRRFAQDVDVFENPCLGLVEAIEAGATTAVSTQNLLYDCVQPMLDAGVDTLVLGCTHYPFIRPLLETIVGSAAAIIDPAPAVARQTRRVLTKRGQLALPHRPGVISFYTTGNADTMQRQIDQLWSLANNDAPAISISTRYLQP